MLRPATAIAALALVLVPTAPANATGAGVDSCIGRAPSRVVTDRDHCVLVATSGRYVLEITSLARFAWAELTCASGAHLFVDVWDVQGGYDYTEASLGNDVCLLTVAASGGPAAGSVWKE